MPEAKLELLANLAYDFDDTVRRQMPLAFALFLLLFHLGILVEEGETNTIFTNPRDERTQDYITGRFG